MCGNLKGQSAGRDRRVYAAAGRSGDQLQDHFVFGSLSGRALCGKAIERFNQKVDRTCGVGPGRNRPAKHKRELKCAVRDIGDVQKPPLDFRVTWNGLIDGHRYPSSARLPSRYSS